MPREEIYWNMRNRGKCVECGTDTAYARCPRCLERRRLVADRSGSERTAGRGRRVGNSRERKREHVAYLRTGRREGLKPDPELVRRIRAEARMTRNTAPRPPDGKLPRNLTLDRIEVESWTIRATPWAYPSSWDTADVRLAAAPVGWRRSESRWITLRWIVSGEEREQDVKVRVQMISATDLRLAIDEVPQ